MSDTTIAQVRVDTGPHYEPYSWHHWPEYPRMSYQSGAIEETPARRRLNNG